MVTYRQKGKRLSPGEGGIMDREETLTDACKRAIALERKGYVILNILNTNS
jgi:hypothetical protein